MRAGHGGDHLGPVLGDAGILVFASDHEAGDVLQEHQRNVALVAEFDEVRTLQRRFGEQDAVVGDDADRVTVDVGETGDQGLRVAGLELGEFGTVDDACDQFADVERDARFARHDAVDLLGGIGRFARFEHGERDALAAIEVGDEVARDTQCMGVAFGEMVGHARY